LSEEQVSQGAEQAEDSANQGEQQDSITNQALDKAQEARSGGGEPDKVDQAIDKAQESGWVDKAVDKVKEKFGGQ
jgi:hypothetical protein